MFCVKQLDHVEVQVRDRYAAAEWFKRVLGLEIVPEFEVWAEDPDGPLMIATPEGNTKVALFTGEPQGEHPQIGSILVAFGVDGDGFLAFLDHIQTVKVLNDKKERVTHQHVKNHTLAYSIYFCDPDGNHYEVTTYDVATVRAKLDA